MPVRALKSFVLLKLEYHTQQVLAYSISAAFTHLHEPRSNGVKFYLEVYQFDLQKRNGFVSTSRQLKK